MKESVQDNIAINYKALFQVFWKEKTLFILIILSFIALGFLHAFIVKEQFVSEGKILPEIQSKNGKFDNLAGLASLAGLDINNIDGSDAIRPDMYPYILKSTPFFLALFQQEIKTKDNKTLKFEDFYHQYIEDGKKIDDKNLRKFPVKEDGFLVLNRLSEKRIDKLKKLIDASIDIKSGIISISVKMPDPVVAAKITHFSMVYLTDYITKYRTDKQKVDVDFLEAKVQAAKGKYYSSQTQKAQYSDQFQLPTIRLQSADIQRERIEADYRTASTFYNELLKKYEEAKIRLQQETPVFQVLEPPITPTDPAEPKKVLILISYIFLGGITSIIAALIKDKNFKQVIFI